MGRKRIPLIVDNSNAVDTKGSTVQVSFAYPIDLDMDKSYALTVTEVDVTYIHPNLINGNVGFSYVYTCPTTMNSKGYVMRSMFDATQSAKDLIYYNSNNIIQQTPSANGGIGSLTDGNTITGAYSNLTDANPATNLTVSNTNTSQNFTGVTVNYTISFNTSVSAGSAPITSVSETLTLPSSLSVLYFYYNLSQSCNLRIYQCTDSSFNISTATTMLSLFVNNAGANLVSFPVSISTNTTSYFAVSFGLNANPSIIYDAFFEMIPSLIQNFIQNVSFTTGVTGVATYTSNGSLTASVGTQNSFFTDALTDTIHKFTTSTNFSNSNPFLLTLGYQLTFLPSSITTLNYINYYFNASLAGVLKFYLADASYVLANATYIDSVNYDPTKPINSFSIAFPNPQTITGSSTANEVNLYLMVTFTTGALTTSTALTVSDAFFICYQTIPNAPTYPSVRTNSSGSVIDKWASFYNFSTNTYNDCVVPVTDNLGNQIAVNNKTSTGLMTVAQGLPTGLYNLDDLQLELYNILERDPAYVSANSGTGTISGYPPFKLVGDSSTEQVQIMIYDPNLYIELPMQGAYAKNNILWYLGFDPVVAQDISAVPNLFTSTMGGFPVSNYLSVWSSSTFSYSPTGTKVYPASVPKLAGSYPIPIYANTSARLNQLTAYYLNTDLASGTWINGNARNVIASITPVDAQVGAIYSYRPFFPLQVPISKKYIDQATFWITDQNGNLADFSNAGQNDNPESWSFRAFIEEMD